MTRSLALIFLLSFVLVVGILPGTPGEAGKLADDGRAGVVLDVQGAALLRPAGRERWTPLGPKSVLYPGDLIRTRARGAHALEVSVVGGKALLGPGTELQLMGPGELRLLRGELELVGAGPDGHPLTIHGPGDFGTKILGTAWLRTEGKRTSTLDKAPRWVEGYRASASDEWMGSLLAKVDGRDVPLAVGYHKVGVEVRDQIARTTVEQSFVNSTSARLEGVFYFPLPADASISGFGMWIGGELVEADIVERQRARQIYEDILRRKKDPGLLEWEGGNIFKARVFPIEPHSEKRIRIRYTQVLPLEGDTWRYRYALRSELLRSKPLRELSLRVSVASSVPLRSVASPTHEVVLHQTEHEATAEFRASEYRPEQDFELAVRVNATRELTAVPHRRGEDGYFMVLLAPPDGERGTWQRELVPEGAPLDLVLLADTSASMDEAARAHQATFLGALLDLLGPKDRFRLAACDSEVAWLAETPRAAGEADVVLEALATRRSLGWTDLDGALAAALAAATEKTLIVYVGDGVGTTGDADPIALAERLRAAGREHSAVVHAVAPSSSYESAVLQALASIGGGSLRVVGDQPARDAGRLLAEAARPSVRDLRVEVQGLRTARVYPARLPNLPLGTQQVVLGRFLPSEEPQEGTVIVTGTLEGKPVRYSAPLRIEGADVGNSFLPRLWARSHLDALLAEGTAPKVQEEIVAFSERFGIMTPYTSFLVLESDEDRERYGVERRVQMRDGERFFAEAKDRADLEKKRDLMQAAGRWRLQLRRSMLQELARLGRDLPIVAAPEPPVLEVATAEHFDVDKLGLGGGAGGAFPPQGGAFRAYRGLALEEQLRSRHGAVSKDGGDWESGGEGADWGESLDAAPAMSAAPSEMGPPPAASPAPGAPARRGRRAESKARNAEEMEEPVAETDNDLPMDMDELVEEAESLERAAARPADGYFGPVAGKRALYGLFDEKNGVPGSPRGRGRRALTLQALGFPWVPPAPQADEGEPLEPWPEDVLALLQPLPRRALLGSLDGSLHFVIVNEALHPTRGTVHAHERLQAWIGKDAWRVVHEDALFDAPWEHWVYAQVRGALHPAQGLARTRAAEASDTGAWWLPLWDLQARDVLRTWRNAGWKPTVLQAQDASAVTTIEFRRGGVDRSGFQIDVDRTKHVIVETRWYDAHGKLSGRLTRSAFVQVAGRWWATKVERFDARDRRIAARTLQVEALESAAAAAAHAERTASLDSALVVHGPLPEVHEAKQALVERRVKLIDRVVLTLHHGQQQRWDECLAQWAEAERLVGVQDGTRWVRTEILALARQGETYKTWLNDLAPLVERRGAAVGRTLAWRLYHAAASLLGPHERAALLQRLAAAWIDAAAPLAAERRLAWEQRHAANLDAQGEAEQARAVRAALAEAWPHRVPVQLAHEADLWSTGHTDDALALLEGALGREPWMDGERDALATRLTDRLWERRRLTRLHAALERWLQRTPEVAHAWQRWYASFYLLGQAEAGDAAVLEALGLRLDDGAPASAWARQQGAVQVALGEGWHFNLERMEPTWVAALADLALHLVRLDSARGQAAWTIYGNWRFRRHDAWKTLQATLLRELVAEGAVESLSLTRLARAVGWLPWGANGVVDEDTWQSVVSRLARRWSTSTEPAERRALGDHVLTLQDARGKREEAIAFARERYTYALEAKADERPLRARQLFERLLGTPDGDAQADAAREDECFALLPDLVSPAQPAHERRATLARDVRALADRLYRWRTAAHLGAPAQRADLSRAELQLRQRAARTQARADVAARFERAQGGASELAEPWFALERLGYAVEHGAGLPALIDEAARRLGESTSRDDPLERLYRERLAVILAYAATRSETPADGSASVLALFEQGATAEAALRSQEPEAEELLDWRYQIFRLLVARDEAAALQTALDGWIVPTAVDSRWRKVRGYLHAETGDLAAAVAQFEAVQQHDELDGRDYAVLADWYLVLGQDTRRAQALDAHYEREPEWQLGNLVWQHTRRMSSRREGVPPDFDPESLRVLRALFRKASHPANHWWRLRDLYRATKEYRVLESVGDALLGHTKEATYAFLGRMDDLVQEVHEEATLDELARRLQTLLKERESALERRALQLALSRVAARALQVPEADADHAARALAMLRAAAANAWQPGERPLMAEYLRDLGRMATQALQSEQGTQLRALLDAETPGGRPRLVIADALAQTLWAYDQHDAALDTLAGALEERRAAHGGRVPLEDVRSFDRQVNWLAARGRFAEAERLLLAERERWDLPQRRRGLQLLLFHHYAQALKMKGSVSLGRGTALYEAAARQMEQAMLADPAQAGEVLQTYLQLHTFAHESGAPADAGLRLQGYARERMGALLERVPLGSTDLWTQLAGTVRHVSGARDGLALLLERRASEPRWLTRCGYDIWQRAVYSFARWRAEAGSLGELEAPLEALVLDQLESNLRGGGSHGSWFWNRKNKWFWAVKAERFAATAERVAELSGESPAIVQRCAQVLRTQIGYGTRATNLLQSAYARGLLDLGGRWTLTTWLAEDRRFAEALPLADALVEERPDNLGYRLRRVEILAGLRRPEAVREALESAEAHLRDAKLWVEGTAARLGESAAANGLPTHAERWLEEAIALRQESRGHRGGRDSTLARYYRALAKARGALGKTREAVQAASTALLSSNLRNRREATEALEALDLALAAAPSLEAYVESYDAEVEESGLDATVLRKAFARAFRAKGDHAAAVRQLLAARELDALDADVHTQLVEAYDALGDAAGAIDALFGSIRLAPHALPAYRTLAERYSAAGDAAAAERALTTLVETTPHQAAGHRALAEVRESQERWDAAAMQWRQVVRTERLDPTGWLALGRVLIRTGHTKEARSTLEHVVAATWEERFGDVKSQAVELLRRLQQ